MAAFESKVLKYSIHKYSSYSSNYFPENVLENKPEDQSSRWSSDSNNPPQFLLLKLAKPAVVESVTFGKYEKTHVCNVKKFRIFGGLSDANMMELLESGLKNDHVQETFSLKHHVNGRCFPCRFINIVPLQSWGASFNFSIWYIELRGCDNTVFVRECQNWFNLRQEQEVVRLCLKHFRQHNYVEAFEALQRQTRVSLEHPALTDLHTQLVCNGDFVASERLLESAVQEGWFNSFVGQQDYKTSWLPIEPVQPDGVCSENRPDMRGGHQMCIDASTETIYLFGGWDGHHDLGDLWSYHVPHQRWTCLSKNVEDEGGPSARSCHKICLDCRNKQIFTLGRYVDPASRTPESMKGDFYVYDIEGARWTLITDDTAAMGGPALIFDHQMAIDEENQTIYVFGGRVLTCSTNLSGNTGSISSNNPAADVDNLSDAAPVLSGLYSYYIPTSTWKKLRNSRLEPQPRIGHSMLFHPRQRCLYIFAGQRNKECLHDFWLYYVDTDAMQQISDGLCKDIIRGPTAGFTQRATLDPDLNEIHVLTGLSRDKEKDKSKDKVSNVHNSLWIYDIEKNKWSCIYSNDRSIETASVRLQSSEPVPRYAHQFVYDNIRKVHYLFGGNPGKDSLPKLRLDDFWALKLCRPSHGAVLQECRYLLRRHRFEELAKSDPVTALHYLQTDVYETVDHNNPEKKLEFQMLPTALFKDKSDEEEWDESLFDTSFSDRTALFDHLVQFFPESMTQPRASMVNLVRLD